MSFARFDNNWVNLDRVDRLSFYQAGSVFYVSATAGGVQYIGTQPYSSLADTNAAIVRILSGNLSEINV